MERVIINMDSSSNPMQSAYALQIPKLKRWAEQAARKAEDEKRRSFLFVEKDGRVARREVHWEDERDNDEDDDDEDPDLRQSFVQYRLQLIKEEEDRRIEERAAYNKAKEEARQKAEDESRRLIEQKAIDDYKREQEAALARRLERTKNFEKELAQIGVDQSKIESIIASQGFKALEWESFSQSQSQGRLLQNPKSDQDMKNEMDDEQPVATSKVLAAELPSRKWKYVLVFVRNLFMKICRQNPGSFLDHGVGFLTFQIVSFADTKHVEGLYHLLVFSPKKVASMRTAFTRIRGHPMP